MTKREMFFDRLLRRASLDYAPSIILRTGTGQGDPFDCAQGGRFNVTAQDRRNKGEKSEFKETLDDGGERDGGGQDKIRHIIGGIYRKNGRIQ